MKQYLVTIEHKDGTKIIKAFETIRNAKSTIEHLTGVNTDDVCPTEIKADTNRVAFYWKWEWVSMWTVEIEMKDTPDRLPVGMLFHSEAEADKWISQFADVVFGRN